MGSGITTKFALFMVSVTQTLDPKVTNRPQLDNDKTRPPHAMRTGRRITPTTPSRITWQRI